MGHVSLFLLLPIRVRQIRLASSSFVCCVLPYVHGSVTWREIITFQQHPMVEINNNCVCLKKYQIGGWINDMAKAESGMTLQRSSNPYPLKHQLNCLQKCLYSVLHQVYQGKIPHSAHWYNSGIGEIPPRGVSVLLTLITSVISILYCVY